MNFSLIQAMDSGSDSDDEKVETVAQLIASAQKHNLDMREFVQEKDENGYTLLHAAAETLDVESARYCLQHGAQAEDRASVGYHQPSALGFAVQAAYKSRDLTALPPMMELLFSHGALVSTLYCAHFQRNCRILRLDKDLSEKCNALLHNQLRKQENVPEKEKLP